MENKTSAKGGIWRKVGLLALLGFLVVVELGYRFFNGYLGITEDMYMMLTRFIGGGACIFFMLEFSFQAALRPLGNKKIIPVLAILPAFVIAINNFPFVSFFSGEWKPAMNTREITMFALSCLCVGFFEEMAFRGCALMFFLKKRTGTRLGVFLSIIFASAIFGLVHMLNLFTSSPGAVFMQIGYSTLIGALCSVVLLTTENIWLCVLCHGLYNFCGGMNGVGEMWTTPQMIFTAVVAVAVAAYMIWLFFKIPLSNAQSLIAKKDKEEAQ